MAAGAVIRVGVKPLELTLWLLSLIVGWLELLCRLLVSMLVSIVRWWHVDAALAGRLIQLWLWLVVLLIALRPIGWNALTLRLPVGWLLILWLTVSLLLKLLLALEGRSLLRSELITVDRLAAIVQVVFALVDGSTSIIADFFSVETNRRSFLITIDREPTSHEGRTKDQADYENGSHLNLPRNRAESNLCSQSIARKPTIRKGTDNPSRAKDQFRSVR